MSPYLNNRAAQGRRCPELTSQEQRKQGAGVGCHGDACQPGGPMWRQAKRGLGEREREGDCVSWLQKWEKVQGSLVYARPRGAEVVV